VALWFGIGAEQSKSPVLRRKVVVRSNIWPLSSQPAVGAEVAVEAEVKTESCGLGSDRHATKSFTRDISEVTQIQLYSVTA